MRTSWLTVILLLAFSSVGHAQQGSESLVGAANPKDREIHDVIPFDQYEGVTARIRAIIVSQRDLIQKVDAGVDVSAINAQQAQANYLEKLKYLRGLKEQLENAYRGVDPKNTTEVRATKAVAADYVGYLYPVFTVAELAQPHFINDCAELARTNMLQHFNLNGKDAAIAFRGDKVLGTFITRLCPKYSN